MLKNLLHSVLVLDHVVHTHIYRAGLGVAAGDFYIVGMRASEARISSRISTTADNMISAIRSTTGSEGCEGGA